MISHRVGLEKLLNYLLVFLLPTQLAIHFWPPFAFVFGIRVDYLAPSIYLTDILFLSLFINWFVRNHNKLFDYLNRNKKYILLFLFIAILNSVFSTSVLPSIFKWIKLTELGLFCFYVHTRKDIFKSKFLLTTLYYSLVFFSLIGIFQFISGKTLGGLFYLLGERSFSISTPGIALTQFLGRIFLRAYSTFSHPNSLAGYLGLGILVLYFTYSKEDLTKRIPGMIIIITAFLLSFSLSAFIGLLVCVLLCVLIKRRMFLTNNMIYIPGLLLLVSLLFPFTSRIILQNKITLPENFKQRSELSLGAGSMISHNFFLGAGLNTFVINEPKIKNMDIYLWSLQPVHNIFLLIFSETGYIGISVFYLLLIKFLNNKSNIKNQVVYLSLIFILISGLFDHYWFTLQQNMFFAIFVLANPLRFKS